MGHPDKAGDWDPDASLATEVLKNKYIQQNESGSTKQKFSVIEVKVTSATKELRTESGNLSGSSFLGGVLVLNVQLDHSL